VKRFRFLVCLALVLLLVHPVPASADSPKAPANTTTPTAATTAATTSPSDRTGGSIYFDTYPPGATIWLDDIDLGTTPFTYYSEKTGIRNVRILRKGYENYTTTVTVTEGTLVDFYARLTPVSRTPAATTVPLPSATTIRKSTIRIPTSWPTTPPASPVDPAVALGAAAVGAGLVVIRRR
jgi:hypothetical protein